MPITPAFGVEERQGDQKFKVILRYIESWKPVQDTWTPSQKQNETK